MKTIEAVAGATPTTRERYIDLLRALSIGVVVVGHWLLAIVTRHEGSFAGENALAVIPGVWILTWILQVMPLFFFVGGFSNLLSWESTARRGGRYADFVRTRFARLLRPMAVFAAVWLVLAAVLRMLGVPAGVVRTLASTVAIPLWFMAVYLIVILLTPAMISLHRRFGVRVPAGFIAGALAVDIVARGFDVRPVGALNFAFVWMLPHQLGFFYGDGTFARVSRRAFTTIGGLSLLGVAVLTITGFYAGSMVGVPGAPDSNNSPPTLALALHSIWMVGFAMALRAPAARWLQRPPVWKAVIGVNAVIMTVFLWHMTALIVGALVMLPLGFPQPDAGSTAWWLLRPIWVVMLAAVLTVFIRAFGRIEIRGLLDSAPTGTRTRAGRTVVGATASTLGVIIFAQTGFAPDATAIVAGITVTPLLAAVALGAGMIGLRPQPARDHT